MGMAHLLSPFLSLDLRGGEICFDSLCVLLYGSAEIEFKLFFLQSFLL